MVDIALFALFALICSMALVIFVFYTIEKTNEYIKKKTDAILKEANRKIQESMNQLSKGGLKC